MIIRETLENCIGLTYHAPKVTVGFSAYINAAQDNLVDSTNTRVNLDSESYDYGGNFSVVTHLFTAPIAGRYLFVGQVGYKNQIVNKRYSAMIFKNAAVKNINTAYCTDVSENTFSTAVAIFDMVAGDTASLYARSDSGDNTVDIYPGDGFTFLAGELIVEY